MGGGTRDYRQGGGEEDFTHAETDAALSVKGNITALQLLLMTSAELKKSKRD